MKLWHIGITGSLWFRFKAYLTHRQQYVKINNNRSSLLPVLSGVLQGSILGPLLFIIFINDLPRRVSYSSLLLFADDAKCLSPLTSSIDHKLLQCDLNQLTSWSKEWNLSFNIQKCTQLSFGSNPGSHCPATYHIDNTPINKSDQQRDLGVILSCDLSWSQHIQSISARAYKILGLIRRTFSSVNSVYSKKYSTFLLSALT